MKILVVAENDTDFDQLTTVLQNNTTVNITRCLSYASFKKTIDTENIDVVISDHRPVNSLTTDLLIYARSKFPFIPFIVVSSELNEEILTALYDEGITDYLSKESTGRLHFIINRACKEYRNKIECEKKAIPQYINHASVSVLIGSEKKNTNDESKRSNKEILSIDKINRALTSGKSILKISALMLEGLFETTGINQSRIYLYDRDQNKLHLYAQKLESSLVNKIEKKAGAKMEEFIPKLNKGSIIDTLIREQKSLFTHDDAIIEQIVNEHSDNKILKSQTTWAIKIVGINTLGLYPLIDKNKVIGLLSISTPLLLNDEEKNTVERYATQLAAILSKKQDLDKLIENEQQFKKIFESIHDVFYQTDSNGEVILISPSVKQLLGYEPDEILGKPISQFYANAKLRALKIARLQLVGEIEEFEATLLTKTGTEVTVSIKLNLSHGDKNNIFVVQGLMRDITEKKRQEINLENQRKKLLEIVKLNTQIIETSDQFFYVLKIKNPFEYANPVKYISPQISNIFGISELQMLNRKDRWFSLIHPDDQKHVKDSIEQIFQSQKPRETTYRVLNQKTELYIWVDDYACPLLDETGMVIEIYGSVKDVSERKNALEKIENEKKQSLAYQIQLLSAQLNPHFIYNTLNSFQYYILKGHVEESLNRISEFSDLMRKVLENSMSQQITIEDEITFLNQYIMISKYRMQRELTFDIYIDPEIEISEHSIPPMLLQPYIENAMIHGFFGSPHDPVLKLSFIKIDDRIFCCIQDNGIGREKARERQQLQLSKHSFAMGINRKRISLLNQTTPHNFKVEVLDLKDEKGDASGTRVVVNYLQITGKSSE